MPFSASAGAESPAMQETQGKGGKMPLPSNPAGPKQQKERVASKTLSATEVMLQLRGFEQSPDKT